MARRVGVTGGMCDACITPTWNAIELSSLVALADCFEMAS
jgi:hypothetical protein